MYFKVLFVVYNEGKIQLQRQLLHTCYPFFRSVLFSFKLATFFCPGATFNSFNFQRIVNTNNHLSVLFRPLVSNIKDKNFPCTSVFYQVVLENVIQVLLQCIWAKRILMDMHKNFIQTLLIQPKMYSTLWSDNRRELDTPFPIKNFVSIRKGLNFFDVILPLFCKCDRLE